MTRKALVLMAFVLAAATVATAATAFAGSEQDKLILVKKEVAEAIHQSADAARRAKVRTLRLLRQTQDTVKPVIYPNRR